MVFRDWLQLATLGLSIAVLLVAAGRAFGRTESKQPATRSDDEANKLVTRYNRNDFTELNRRFNVFEEDWRQNREEWHTKFNEFETNRARVIREFDRLFLRADVADEKFNGIWQAIKELRARRMRDGN